MSLKIFRVFSLMEGRTLPKLRNVFLGKLISNPLKKEHITLIEEPDSKFLGYVSPPSGSARHIASTIIRFFKNKKIDLSAVVAVGCDGTAVNTGFKGGVVRLLEENLKKPLQWIVPLIV